MSGQRFTPVGEYIHCIPTTLALLRYTYITASTAYYKFVFDGMSKNFVGVYMKILNFEALLKNYFR